MKHPNRGQRGKVVSASDLRSGGRGFDSRPCHVVIALGKQSTLSFPNPPTCKMGTQLQDDVTGINDDDDADDEDEDNHNEDDVLGNNYDDDEGDDDDDDGGDDEDEDDDEQSHRSERAPVTIVITITPAIPIMLA
ncbi:replicase polyprotein 1a [Elysia marginata]|uniref:Replicase polyprotein 1a n=1 Tax=Elysia marginata TaxID=1093978 RepID=A0AAV4GJI3_9GAST|nr:replicase polyprotein 1a [Elysia marginata]